MRLRLDIKPRFASANPRVRDNIGKVALERGPLVYCLEGVDQKAPFWESAVTPGAPVTEFRHALPGSPVALRAKGVVREAASDLYAPVRKPDGKACRAGVCSLLSVPECGVTPMQVWVPYANRRNR